MAAVTYSLACSTAAGTSRPCANPAATADANVQPVPWVLVEGMRSVVYSMNSVPSYRMSVGGPSRCPPLMTTDLAPEEIATLLAVPLFHVTGSHAVFLISFPLRRKIVCMYKWDAERGAELIERRRPKRPSLASSV